MINLYYYCQLFSQLNVSNSSKRGNAKYKPILILSVIDLIAQGVITHNQIPVSNELIQTFDKYWDTIGSHLYKGGLHYPFFHLQNEGVWYVVTKTGFNGLQPKTTNKLKEAVDYAYVDNELFLLLQDDFSRRELIDALVTSFFHDSLNELEEILQINQNVQDDAIQNIATSENLENNPQWTLRKTVIRNAFFRKSIIYVYDYKCAFCGLRVTKPLNQNIEEYFPSLESLRWHYQNIFQV
jgi:putative restriction endonuclease